MASGDERHIGKWVAPKDIPYMPTQVKVEGLDNDVTVDYALEREIPAVYDIINDCRRRGDNWGVTELDDYEAWYDNITVHAFVFTVKVEGNLVGALILRPHRLSRSMVPCTAELFIHLLKPYRPAFKPLALLAERITVDFDVGYFQITYGVFYCCTETMFDIRSLGYKIGAIIPKVGIVKGKGLMENVILFKQLLPEIPYRQERFDECMKSITDLGWMDGEEEFDKVPLPQAPGLPQTYKSGKGIGITVRNMELKDHKWIYAELCDSVEIGLGYTTDDFPPYQGFRTTFFSKAHVAIMEVADTGERCGFLLFLPSGFLRGRENLVCDSFYFIDTKFKGLGLGHEITHIWLSLSKELGYRYTLSSVVLNNWRIFALGRKADFVFIGTLPFMGNMKGAPFWMDASIIAYSVPDSQIKFTDFVKQRNEEAKTKQIKAQI